MNIRLPLKLKQFLDGEIKAGRFKNTSDAISEGIRLLIQRADLPDAGINQIKHHKSAVLGDVEGGDVEAMAFLVMMEAAKSAQEDLKAIMAEVKAINTAKSSLRDLIVKVGYDVAENARQRNGQPALVFNPSGIGSESGYTACPYLAHIRGQHAGCA